MAAVVILLVSSDRSSSIRISSISSSSSGRSSSNSSSSSSIGSSRGSRVAARVATENAIRLRCVLNIYCTCACIRTAPPVSTLPEY